MCKFVNYIHTISCVKDAITLLVISGVRVYSWYCGSHLEVHCMLTGHSVYLCNDSTQKTVSNHLFMSQFCLKEMFVCLFQNLLHPTSL